MPSEVADLVINEHTYAGLGVARLRRCLAGRRLAGGAPPGSHSGDGVGVALSAPSASETACAPCAPGTDAICKASTWQYLVNQQRRRGGCIGCSRGGDGSGTGLGASSTSK